MYAASLIQPIPPVSSVSTALIGIPLLPLVAFVLLILVGRRLGRLSAWVSMAAWERTWPRVAADPPLPCAAPPGGRCGLDAELDDRDRRAPLGEHHSLSGLHGPDGLRELLVGLPQPKPHRFVPPNIVVTSLQ